jgi:hypothetical protein
MDTVVWLEEGIMLWWIHWVILVVLRICQRAGKNEELLLEGCTM